MSQQPQAGGRYYREQDGTLTRAGDDGSHPNAAVEKTAAGKPAKRNTVKDETDA